MNYLIACTKDDDNSCKYSKQNILFYSLTDKYEKKLKKIIT